MFSRRYVSTQIHFDQFNNLHEVASNMFTQFGQFIDHDLTLTPEFEDAECCERSAEKRKKEKKIVDKQCFNIHIPTGRQCTEAYFGPLLPLNDTCPRILEFVRSTPFCANRVQIRYYTIIHTHSLFHILGHT